MKERYEDALERIRLIPAERTTAEPFCSFFRDTAEYILTMDEWYRRFEQEDILHTEDIMGLREMNAALYGPLLPGGRMAEWLGAGAFSGPRLVGEDHAKSLGDILKALLRELTALIPAVYEKREERITAALELFIQVYCLYEEAFADAKPLTRSPLRHPTGARQLSCRSAHWIEEAFADAKPLTRSPLRHPTGARQLSCRSAHWIEEAFADAKPLTRSPREKTVHDAFYSYFYDYSEEMQEEVLREHFDPRDSYLQRFLLTANTSSSEYLYRSGEYVSPAQLKRYADTQALSETAVEAQLKEWRVQLGICGGFPRFQRGEAKGRRPYVLLQAVPGRERLYQALVRSLQDEGIGIIMPRAARGILMCVPEKRPGYYESPNLQMDWLHDYDLALLMGDRLTSRLLEERRHLLTALSREGNVCIGVLRDPAADMTRSGAEESGGHRLRFTEHQDTVYRNYCQKAEELTRAALMENETAEEAEHGTTL